MNFKTAITITFILFVIKSTAQENNITGSVNDTLNKKYLSNASVMILRAKDSVLVKFARTSNDGSFKLLSIPQGKYILQISNPTYADYSDIISINDKSLSLGIIPLITKEKLLEEVVVKQKIAAIRMKGDTTEYRADSFRVGANANVQELLKKLPGITVNGKGEITAQGETVKKVLVDGEEFFSDDPAVVTQNLRADAIDKVQVFDKKSDQAAFTGIDDGEKNKTINLQLKDDKKKGYFGKIEAGTNFKDYRTGKVLANAFKAKSKVAAYITNDNTKFESLNWEEKRSYGEDLNSNTEVNDDGGMSMWSNGDDFSWGQGLPTSTTAGLHYSQKWNKDKHNIINTYQYNNLDVTGTIATDSKTLIDSTFTTGNTSQTFTNNKNRNRLRTTYEWTIDSTSSLKTILTGSVVSGNTSNTYSGNSNSAKGELINNTFRTTTNNEKNETLLGTVFWRKKLKKKGRTISVNTDIDMVNEDNNGYLFTNNLFYNSGVGNIELTDQYKTSSQNKFSISSKATYTEPLSKKVFLELNYKFQNNKNDAARATYSKPSSGNSYTNIVDSLSNHFIFNTIAHTGSFNIKFKDKKINYTIGSGLGAVTYKLNDLQAINNRSVSFTNFLPYTRIEFTPKKQTRLELTYHGRTNNPTLSQIQPIIDNSDPLNIRIGNQNLQQEFQHHFTFNFSKYQIIKSKSIYIYANFNTTQNAITSSNNYDIKTGKNVSQYVNVNGNYNFYMWSSYRFEALPSFNLNFNFSPSIMRYSNFMNGNKNTNDTKTYNFSVGTSYWGDKWYNYYFDIGPSYNTSKSTINPSGTNYWSYSLGGNLELKFKKQKLYFDIDARATLYQKTTTFTNTRDTYVASVGLRKSLDKSENWQAKIFANDIFNTNSNIDRNISSNYISQTTKQVVQRYVMFSIIYNFNKNKKASE